jgi:hypothetical protein
VIANTLQPSAYIKIPEDVGSRIRLYTDSAHRHRYISLSGTLEKPEPLKLVHAPVDAQRCRGANKIEPVARRPST